MFIALGLMQRPEWVMMGPPENIQACLRDFQTAAASMAHMRHLASTARGFYCFCLTARYGFKKFKRFNGFKSVLSVQSVVEIKIASALLPGRQYHE